MPKISMDKQYKTRDGKSVTILHTNRRCQNGFPVVALVHETDQDRLFAFTNVGEFAGYPSKYDLIEVPEEHEIHVLKFTDGSMTMQLSERLSELDIERWKQSPYYLGTTKVILPVKE